MTFEALLELSNFLEAWQLKKYVYVQKGSLTRVWKKTGAKIAIYGTLDIQILRFKKRIKKKK